MGSRVRGGCCEGQGSRLIPVLGRAFPVDRVALAAHGDLELTEARVRGALAVLERVGFVVREAVKGSAFRPTQHGLRRKPVLFRFSPEFMAAFETANAAAQRARGVGSTVRRAETANPQRPPAGPVSHPTGYRPPSSPQLAKKETPVEAVSLGDWNPAGSDSGLEAALARLRAGIERGAE